MNNRYFPLHFRRTFLFLACFCAATALRAQVSCTPIFPKADDEVTIFFDASQGNGALSGFVPVFAHMGVVTDRSQSLSDWKYVKTTWAVANAASAMQYVSPNLFKKTFNIRSFFGVPANEKILQMAFVFRNGDGSTVGRSTDGSDIYYPVYPDNAGLLTTFIAPTASFQLVQAGESIPVKAAASQPGKLFLYDNGQEVFSTSGEILEAKISATAGLHKVDFVAVTATDKDTSSFSYLVPADLPRQNPPTGTQWGVNEAADGRSAVLALPAPGKKTVYAVGDFSDWQPIPQYQMRASEDGATWWVRLEGLTPGRVYRYQYWVDGTLRIADPMSTLVLDPFNDGFIPAATFPNRPAYPTGKTTGAVTVFQPGAPAFNWQTTNYVKPKKADLIVYELHLRDFVARHDFQTLRDSLDYLQRLGITAIELMPVNEFDGNISWGYNPAFHNALDKYYGDPTAFKRLVDECHRRGMAVIIDVVFNHATGASPLAQLYWDAARNQPAANNPWLNPTARHDFNVFNDFNHESKLTRQYVRQCLQYWLREYRIDGYRFDLSKGFTQKNTIGNVGAWGQYDAARVAVLKEYAAAMWAVDPTSYAILEHFADNTEEQELAEAGMMLWGNQWGAFKEVGLGYPDQVGGITTPLTGALASRRGWDVPHLIGYMESHDEDRLAFEMKSYGNREGDYNIKDIPTGLRRLEMLTNLFYPLPGPKMLWQFGELGYDFTINYCENGTVNNNCRTSPKPIRWDYLQDPNRRRLYDVTRSLLHLRKQYDVFETATPVFNGTSDIARTIVMTHPQLNVVVIANVGMTPFGFGMSFPKAGTWYEYYTGQTIEARPNINVTNFAPGEYRLYLDRFVPLPAGVRLTTSAPEADGPLADFSIYPNPATDAVSGYFTLQQGGTVRIEVYDWAGRLILAQPTQQLSAGEQRFDLSTESWSPGVYHVHLRTSGGATLTKPVVIVD